MYSVEKFCGCCKINVVTWSKVVAIQGLIWGPIYIFFGLLYLNHVHSVFAEIYSIYSMREEIIDTTYDVFQVNIGNDNQVR